MAANKEVALRKRQQIDSSKRTMFIAVAVAAFVVGSSLVVVFFLAQQIWFHAEIIGDKQKTLNTINKNIDTAEELKGNIRALEANSALNSVKANDDDSALQVILDALPAEPNADALGASLQVRFAGAVDGLKIESLTVNSVDSVGVDAGEMSGSEEDSPSQSIGFNLSVSGSADRLKDLLARMEKSIRVIEVTSLELLAGDERIIMNISGRAYYQPARTIQLGEKVKKPNEKN